MGRSGAPDSSTSGGRTLFEIKFADGDSRGSNLFHSFEKFDLTSAEAATFLGPSTVKNILARVTGGSPSSIDGKLSSSIAGANLFFMNPKGIVFGPNASVDVSGSFFATTADYIKLGESGRFAASGNPADSVLSVSDPSAFGFLTPNPAAIRVQGSKLTGPDVKTLGFVGGDVSITGDAELQAEDVQLISVRSVGEVGLQLPAPDNTLRWAEINLDGIGQRGAISVDGTPADPVNPLPGPAIQSQRVVIRGGTFVMKQASITTINSGPGDGVKAHLTESLQMDRSTIDSYNFGDMMGTNSVDITARDAVLESGSGISTQTGPDGAGGNLRLAISGSLRLSGQSAIVTNSYSPVQGGNLAVSAGSIALENHSTIHGENNEGGKGGNISVKADGALTMSGGSSIGLRLEQSAGETIFAEAGEISITGFGSGFRFFDADPENAGTGGVIKIISRGTFSIRDAGQVFANTVGRDGVLVDIRAASMSISGANTSDVLATGIISSSSTGPLGRGGEIRLAITGALNVLDGGVISTDAKGSGTGGNIEIAATDITVTGRAGTVANYTDEARGITARNLSNDPDLPSGPGGNIHLTLSGRLDVRDGGEVIVDARGSGAGGSIQVDAGQVSVSGNGTIAARTFAGRNAGAGGNVRLNVTGELSVGAHGLISTSTEGPGAAGSIDIRSSTLRVSGSGAAIAAVSGAPRALGATGSGGNVFVDTRELIISNDGQITASTYGPGAGGSIRVEAGRVRIEDSGGAQFAGLSAQTLSMGAGGPGGMISVTADFLELRGAGALISTQSQGAGNAGQIRIDAGTISLRDGGGIQSSSAKSGRAGDIDLAARQTITLRDGGFVSVAAAQSDAGSIRLQAGRSITLTNASITADAALNGGDIDLRARDRIALDGSEIIAAAGLNGGNIFIDPIFVFLDRSLISANAIVGRGGNIRIISDYFFASPDSLVTATSELGVDGTVRIDALNNDLRGSLVELPSQLIDADSLLRDLCTMKIDDFSSFVSEGRGGLPPLPGEPMPSLMIQP